MHKGQIAFALRPLSQKVWALCFPHAPNLVILYATLEGRGGKNGVCQVYFNYNHVLKLQIILCFCPSFVYHGSNVTTSESTHASGATGVPHLEEVHISI